MIIKRQELLNVNEETQVQVICHYTTLFSKQVVWVYDLLAFILWFFELINLTFTVWCY